MAKTYSKKDIFEGKLFDEAINEANQMIKVLEVMDTKIVQLSTTYKTTLNSATTNNKKGIEDIIKVSNELNVVTEQANKIEKDKIATSEKLRKAELDQAKAYEQFTKEVQKRQAIEEKAHAKREAQYNKEIQQTDAITKKEAERAEKLSGSYAKVQIKLNQLSNVYRDLAIKKEMGLTLTDKEEKRYTSLQGRIQMYDKALKATDASMGKHQRNVGNYASAYNGLNMSVSQLAREMPAFANSVQTGFMAISNNLPMFFDEIQKIKVANKELTATGQPTQSLFKQLAGSVFSVSSLLSVGVTLLTVYGAKVVEMLSGSQKTEEQLKKEAEAREALNKKKREGAEFVGKESAQMVGYLEALKATNKGSKERAEMIAKINDQYGTHLKNLKDEAAFQAQVNDMVREYIQYQREAFKIKRNTELIESNLTKQEIIISKLVKSYGLFRSEIDKAIKTGNIDELTNKIRGNGKATEELVKAQKESAEQALKDAPLRTEANKEFAESNTQLEQMIEDLKKANERLTYYGLNIANAESGMGKWRKTTKSQTESQKELNTELGYTDEYLSRYVELQKDLNDTLSKRKLDIIQAQADDEFQLQKDIAENLHQYDITKLTELINLRKENEIQYQNELTAYKIEEIRKRYALETEEELKALEERYSKLLNQEGLTANAKAEIDRQYQLDKENIANNDLIRQTDMNLEIQNAETQHQDRMNEINKNAQNEIIKDQAELDKILMDGNQKILDDQAKKNKEEKDKEKAHLKEMSDLRKSYLNGIFDEMKRISNEKEALLDKEIEAEKKQQDNLQAQANAGNIDAQNSIKASIEAQKQATVEKQKEVDKQRRYDELKMLYNLIEAKIEKGDGAIQATGKSMAEMAIIKGAAKLLSGFKKGTKKRVRDEMNPNVDLGSDPDNRIIRVAGDEGILTGEKMNLLEKAGIHTTDEIVNAAIQSKVNIKQDVAGNSYDLLALQGKLDAIEKAIINKPETNIELGLITQNAMEIIERRTQGNKTTTNAFKVK
jgi:hypothetical protein